MPLSWNEIRSRAVDARYRKSACTSDAQRVEFLFERYQHLTSLLAAETAKIFAKERASFVLVARSRDKVESLAHELSVLGATKVVTIILSLFICRSSACYSAK